MLRVALHGAIAETSTVESLCTCFSAGRGFVLVTSHALCFTMCVFMYASQAASSVTCHIWCEIRVAKQKKIHAKTISLVCTLGLNQRHGFTSLCLRHFCSCVRLHACMHAYIRIHAQNIYMHIYIRTCTYILCESFVANKKTMQAKTISWFLRKMIATVLPMHAFAHAYMYMHVCINIHTYSRAQKPWGQWI
jgi:hypothetical protein